MSSRPLALLHEVGKQGPRLTRSAHLAGYQHWRSRVRAERRERVQYVRADADQWPLRRAALMFGLNTFKCASYGALDAHAPLLVRLFRDGSAYFAM